jgi:hypothetical protein
MDTNVFEGSSASVLGVFCLMLKLEKEHLPVKHFGLPDMCHHVIKALYLHVPYVRSAFFWDIMQCCVVIVITTRFRVISQKSAELINIAVEA